MSVIFNCTEKILWKYETGGRIYSSPAIVGDFIYFGSGDNNFYSINKATGKKEWEFKTKGAVHSSPVIDNDIVYFGSADGNLYAVDKIKGKQIWKFESAGEKTYDMWDYYLSSPSIDESIVYWGCGDSYIYALERSSGKLKWKYKTGDVVHASPTIYNGNVYVGSFDGYFYSINKINGKLNRKFKTVGAQYSPKGKIQKAALVKDDVAYFGSRDYNIYALNIKTGRGIWNMKQQNGWIIGTPIEYKDFIYFGTSDNHIFYCMNKNKREIIWQKKINMRVYGSALAKDDIIYFGAFNGKVYGVDYLTGITKWIFQTESSKLNYNVMYNEKDEFKDGFSLNAQGFEKAEEMIHSLGSILSSPVIVGQTIYFGSSDGNMYAVKLSN